VGERLAVLLLKSRRAPPSSSLRPHVYARADLGRRRHHHFHYHQHPYGMAAAAAASQRCCFPEFRVLFRAMDLYPWSSISDLTDMDTLDQITEICQAQVMKIFPVLDMLDCGCSIMCVRVSSNS
jgi:hypothetical protein